MATYNRADLLSKQLTAFENQELSTDDFEIIIVNDGSTEETDMVLNEWLERLKNLSVIHQANGGPAAARNRGVEEAKGEIIAFTDDDCIADPDWTKQISIKFASPEVNVVLGHTYTTPEKRTPLTHQIENKKWNPVVPTCNAAYRKSFFEELGGFDTSFPHPHNEDTDLAWRALERGEVHYCDAMKVYHPPVPVPFSKQVKRMNMLQSEFFLYRKNKTAYRKWRAHSPWLTIYSEVFVKHQMRNLRFHLGFYRKPILLAKGLALSVAWWAYLLVLLPTFISQSNEVR
jgi:glycosyltransferase involved in cell wall biosynthesis